ncbi:unnamed protein product [Ectocarpus fasciculatus]
MINVLEKWGGVYEQRWMESNISISYVALLFGVSIVAPLRRLALDPLAATQRNYANRILLSRTEPHITMRRESRLSSEVGGGSPRRRGDSENEVRLEEGELGGVLGKDPITETADANGAVAPCTWNDREPTNASVVAEESSSVSIDNSTGSRRGVFQWEKRERGSGRCRGGRGRSRSDTEEMKVWDFERIARTPLLAAAFEDYSKRALCHESVLFLSEVSRYQNHDYPMMTRSSSGSSPTTQFGSFCYITDTFIKAGSPEEVNIRMIFRRSYRDVKDMLEANLLLRFLSTDRFKTLRMQRENIKAMMDSPPQEAGEELVST